jgi:large subunit ribosomal protein L28e
MSAKGVNMSRDLLWLLTKNNNSHILKPRAFKKRLSTDPMNPKGVQSFRFSGAIQRKAITVEPHSSGKGVNLVYKKRRHQSRPEKSVVRMSLTKDSRRTLSVIKRFCNVNAYRTDLKNVCLRRASAILKSQKTRVPKGKGKTPAKGKKAE